MRRILKQEMYYGAVVGHKRESVGVGGKHSVAVPKDEQLIVEGMHPGIVTKEEFLEAQKIFRKNGEIKRPAEKEYLLRGKVKCGSCGRAMGRRSKTIKGRDYNYFFCKYARSQIGEDRCCGKCLREDVLNGVVWEAIKGVVASAAETEKKIGRKRAAAEKSSTGLVKELADLQKKKSKCEADRFTNMERFMDGSLNEDVYQSRRMELTKEAERLDGLISGLEKKLHEAEVV